MAERYQVNWKVSTKFKRDTFKIFIVLILLFIGYGIGLVMYEISQSNFYGTISFILFTIFVVSLLILVLIWRSRFLKYSAVKEVVLFDDSIVITSLKDLKFNVRFDDIGLIITVKAIKQSEISFEERPFVRFIYYNPQLDRCLEIYLDRKVGEIIVNKYLSYCKEKGRKPAPILDGIIESTGIEDRAISRVESSFFCHRRNRNGR